MTTETSTITTTYTVTEFSVTESGVVLEDACDRCGVDTPNGAGHYPEGVAGDRVCAECNNQEQEKS